MTTHYFHLRQQPFTLFKTGRKTIEARLYDEKRQKIALGDMVEFSLEGDEGQKITTQVVGLLHYRSFADMFAHQSPDKFGGGTPSELTEAMQSYYSIEQQTQYGVLGIEVVAIR